MKLIFPKVSDIGPIPWQPLNRKNVNDIFPLIEEFKMILPIYIIEARSKKLDVKYWAFDGNRRIICAKRLGAETIPAVLFDRELEVKNIEAIQIMSLANTSKRFSTRDHLNLYNAGGILPARLARQVLAITGLYGDSIIPWIIHRKISPNTCYDYHVIAKMMGLSDKRTFKLFLEWSNKFRLSEQLRFVHRNRFSETMDVQAIMTKLKKSFMADEPFVLDVQ